MRSQVKSEPQQVPSQAAPPQPLATDLPGEETVSDAMTAPVDGFLDSQPAATIEEPTDTLATNDSNFKPEPDHFIADDL